MAHKITGRIKEIRIIDKEYAKNLLNKLEIYSHHTKTKKQLFVAMITVNGLKPSMYSEEIVSGGVVELNDLFQDL